MNFLIINLRFSNYQLTKQKMKHKKVLLICVLIFWSFSPMAQVQVSQEPFHHMVFQNKFIRILDVWLQPNDTTQFHVHSTPSVFIYLSNTRYTAQVKGGGWIKDSSINGKTWYRSFSPDILIHRVANIDSVPLHVNDIEILPSYPSRPNGSSGSSKDNTQTKPLNFPVVYNNENAIAYKLTGENFNTKKIKGRGPLVAELITGEEVFFHDDKTNHSKELQIGRFQYIEPGTSFSFFTKRKSKMSMILIEIK